MTGVPRRHPHFAIWIFFVLFIRYFIWYLKYFNFAIVNFCLIYLIINTKTSWQFQKRMRSRLSWKLRSYLSKDVRSQVLCKAYPKNLQKQIYSQIMTWWKYILVSCPKTIHPLQDMNAESWDTAPPTPRPPTTTTTNSQRLQFYLWTNEYQLYNRMSKNLWLKTEKACNTNLRYLTLQKTAKNMMNVLYDFGVGDYKFWTLSRKKLK